MHLTLHPQGEAAVAEIHLTTGPNPITLLKRLTPPDSWRRTMGKGNRKITAIAAAAAAAALFNSYAARAAVDGVIDLGEYGADPNSRNPLALQTAGTSFGNNFNELDGAYGKIDLATGPNFGAINLAITGNVDGNHMLLFLDAKSG